MLEIKPYVSLPFFRRWFSKKTQPTIEKVAVRGGALFYKVTAQADKTGYADLSFLSYTIGAAAQRILPCGALSGDLPEPLRLYLPRVFPLTLFFNTALSFLQANRAQFPNCTLGIADRNGFLQNAVCDFVPFVKSMRIFCENKANYETVQSEILSSNGLSVILCDTLDALKDCDILLSPFEKTADGKIGTLTVFRGGKTVLAGEGVALPPEYEARRPLGTDPLLFASALYECCNVLDLRDLQYEKFVSVPSTKTAGMY
ncbi:MAG: hypothetical protein ACI4LB_04220 [Candidatus Fimenecus sp.]